MCGVRPTVPVCEEPIGTDTVLVGPGFPRLRGGSRDAQGDGTGQNRGLENALGAHERDSLAVELKALVEYRPREITPVEKPLLVEELERLKADLCVALWRTHGFED